MATIAAVTYAIPAPATNFKIENFLTKMRVSITSDPSMSMKRSVTRKDLIEVLLMCGEKQSWTTLN